MARHVVFRATLPADALVPIDSDWTFRVYDGGTLVVEIERAADWRARLPSESSAVEQDRIERERECLYACYDGTAERLPLELSEISQEDAIGSYSCHFTFVRATNKMSVSWIQPTRFTCTLSAIGGLEGYWRNDSTWDEIPTPLAWSAEIEPVSMTLEPLGVGSYSLAGFVMDETPLGFIAAVRMEWTLRADGTLVGETERVWGKKQADGTAPHTAILNGTWTREGVDVRQIYDGAEDAPSHVLLFRGRVSKCEFVGTSCIVPREEMDSSGEYEDRMLLRVTEIQRAWTPSKHVYFPAHFRSAVQTLLRSSLRTSDSPLYLPSALWPRVLAFCDSEWFLDDDA